METLTLTPAEEQYLSTALWATTNAKGDTLDEHYDASDIDEKSKKKLLDELNTFLTEVETLIDGQEERAAHNFWLTRNRYGAGFWDGDWPDGKILTEKSKTYGTIDIYEGGDGKLYVS